MAVHGARVEVRDVDLLLGLSDAETYLDASGIAARPGNPDALFSSAVFASWRAPPFTVELFASFQVRGELLIPATREAHGVNHATVFVPSIAELIAWGRLFGRSKDRAREPLLQVLLRA